MGVQFAVSTFAQKPVCLLLYFISYVIIFICSKNLTIYECTAMSSANEMPSLSPVVGILVFSREADPIGDI